MPKCTTGVYILYEELNSFLNYSVYEAEDEITLEQIPIKGKTQLLLVKLTSEKKIKSQLIPLGKKNRYRINLNKTSVDELNEILKKVSARDRSENPAMER